MIRFLHRHILLPAFETGLKRRKTFAYWRGLERTQWMKRAELEQLQIDALKRLIIHTSSHCEYYEKSWRTLGLEVRQLQSLADFSAWPIVTRETILENRKRMRASISGMKLISKSTGGSSGMPLHFDLDTDSNDRRTAAWHRGYSWAGAAPGTKQFYLWGVDLRHHSRARQWKEKLFNQLHRKRVFSSFDLTEQNIPRIVDELNRYRPDAIVAYTKPLYELARCLRERNVKPFSPKSIVVGAEKLHDFERALIEQIFAAPVFETYGSREFMLIGADCERHEGLHLTMEHLLVEILDDNGQPAQSGDEGDVVITDLFNFGMPFIRYATGDRAIAGFETCSCGRGLPLLKKVVGRQLDILHTPDGRLIPGEFFPHLMKDYAAVRRFQVVQEAIDHVRIRMVTDATWNQQTREQIERLVRQRLGPLVQLTTDYVDEIRLTAAGKLQVVVNRTKYRRAG
jgi:phenylacetate-CoA ligase